MPRRGRQRKLRVRSEELPEFRLSAATKRAVLVVVFTLLALLSLLSFFDEAGAAGKIIAKILTLLFGGASLISPLVFLGVAIALFFSGRKEKEDESSPNLRVYLGAILFCFSITGFLHLLAMRSSPEQAFELVKEGQGGGYLGVLAALPLYSLLDFWASATILGGLIFVSLIVLFNINLTKLFKSSKDLVSRDVIKTVPESDKVKINQMAPAPAFTVNKVPTTKPQEKPQALTPKPEMSDNPDSRDEVQEMGLHARYRKSDWQLPPLEILEDSHDVIDSGNIEANVAIVQKTLQEFGIEVEKGEVNIGPTVTQYTLRPAQGVKLSQILALRDDLALALAAPSIRIEAPIPGRSLVGIEIPNKATAIVRLKDVVSSQDFANNKSSLGFALGRDVAGRPLLADLARMPHLLIAGATGTGKSVAINSLLISFLYRNSPEELRLIVIDPKRVELNLYNGIPHLLTPVITDYEKAVNSLKWAVREMDRRYNLLSQSSKRNILEYNAVAEEKLPYIVVIVDELADLMAVAQAEVEAAVVRLAQMARAVGVHLVLATQRPSVDIITGLIKANITARMAFAVASQVDSRTILDIAGAEKLLGAGDMLYVTADLGKPKRVQGTYVSETEVKSVVNFVKKQAGDVDYHEEILEKNQSTTNIPGFREDLGDEDPVLAEAIEVVKSAGKASASLLQRRLRLGYARAARLLDLMEQKGIVGPADGAKPRDVYVAQGSNESEIEENE